MGLVGNYSVLSKTPGRRLGGTTDANDRSAFSKHGMARNFETHAGKLTGIPYAHDGSYAWVQPRSGGALAAYPGLLTLSVTAAADLVGGGPIESNLSLSVVLSADAALLVSMAADLALSITLGADLVGITDLAASLILAVDLDADMSLLVGLAADLLVSCTLTADASGTAYLETTTVPTELTPESIATALLGAAVDGGYTVQDVLKILVAVAAGKTTIVDLGGGAATVTFRDLPDTLDRVTADMASSERATVTLDLA